MQNITNLDLNQIKTKILVVSDTHGDFDILVKLIKENNPDFILHAGDHCYTKTQLNSLNNFYYVKGNNDIYGELNVSLQINNIKICITHGHIIDNNEFNIINNLIEYFKDNKPNIIIYGHTHKPYINQINHIDIINPGSLYYSRAKIQLKSYIMIYVLKNNTYCIEFKYLL